MIHKKAYRNIISQIKERKITSQHKLGMLKQEIIKRHKLVEIPTNAELAASATPAERKQLKTLLTIKPQRTASGVNVIAIMTAPKKCPHGKCIMCPGGVDSVFGSVPQSYTGKEPATRRAIRNNYDAYMQVFNRLEQYTAMNKIPEKIELIIMGGTFPSYQKKYREEFIAYAFKAMNDFGQKFFDKKGLKLKIFNDFFELPAKIADDNERVKRIQNKILKLKGKSALLKEQKRNEKARIRCVGLTLETRPDYADGREFLRLGATRVELGIQSVYESVLKKIERGHTVKESIKAIQELKDLGFKLNFHYMPGFMPYKEELVGMKQLFANTDFRPDMLKIYPCMVMKGTKLHDLWKKGKFKPLTTRKAMKLIIEFKKTVPEYCRIMRVQRDIPTFMTEAGVDKTNIRQLMKAQCKCIRCREIGNKEIKGEVNIKVTGYDASKGIEYFIQAIDEANQLVGFCRLRFPSDDSSKALIRELHVYGQTEKIGSKGNVQHKGFGKKLLKKAEEICSKENKKKIFVISGVGVREYYKKLGYKLENNYMVKNAL